MCSAADAAAGASRHATTTATHDARRGGRPGGARGRRRDDGRGYSAGRRSRSSRRRSRLAPPMAVVTFLSDYGLDDEFVGVCHGVIARIAPDVRVIDVTHGIARHDVRIGRARAAAGARSSCPPACTSRSSIPGVGSERRAVALRCADEERLLVGPDNGLLMPRRGALRRRRRGRRHRRVAAARSSRSRRASTAATSSRRSPPTSRRARRSPSAGEPLDPARARAARHAARPRRRRRAGRPRPACRSLRQRHARRRARRPRRVRPAARRAPSSSTACAPTYTTTFADVPPGGLLLYEDSYGVPSLAVNRGSALDALGLEIDARVQIARAA